MTDGSKLTTAFVLPSLFRAGAERQTTSLILGLAERGMNCHLVTYGDCLDLLPEIEDSKVKFHHWPRRHRFDTRPIANLARLIDNEDIDVLFGTLQISGFFAWLARRRASAQPKIITAVHTTGSLTFRFGLFDRFLYVPIMARNDRIVFVCENQRNSWVEKFPVLDPVSTNIYNGVDTNRFRPEAIPDNGREFRAEHGIPEDAPLACCVAGFRPEKAHDDLLEAFAIARETVPAAHLALAGDGPLKASILKRAQRLGIEDAVHFCGSLSDVRPLLATSAVSALVSRSETFSMAILESMSMAVPALCSDTGGASEAVDDGITGRLVPIGDVPAIASGMTDYLSSVELAKSQGNAARARALRLFTEKAMIENTARLIQATADA